MQQPKPDLPSPDSPSCSAEIAQLYRGEMSRLTVWCQRLDVTSNWAIVLALTCPSQEQLEDWSTHYRKVAARARD